MWIEEETGEDVEAMDLGFRFVYVTQFGVPLTIRRSRRRSGIRRTQ